MRKSPVHVRRSARRRQRSVQSGSHQSPAPRTTLACAWTQSSISTSVFQHAEAPADADEGIHRLVNLFAGVRGAHLRADARLAPGYDGEEEADDVDAFLEQLLGELLGQRRVVERSEEHTSELQSRENLVC